ncbi:hypothetical protein BD410DRAFT_805956 [Rickenella mellea]|uniref:Uncharacterized protein n=1 Tax=Rickenella mellea TaxID=50990 RepID=A0A4Y7PVW8_9AGAM|nr:hypothetical protein BD410DRAFT_805956 [Rickenella mellea]
MSKAGQTKSRVKHQWRIVTTAFTRRAPPAKGLQNGKTTNDTCEDAASKPTWSNSSARTSVIPAVRGPALSTRGPLRASMGPGTDAIEYSGSEDTMSVLIIPEATPTTEVAEGNQGASSSSSKVVAQQLTPREPPKESVLGNFIDHTGQSNTDTFQGKAAGWEFGKPTDGYFQPKEYLL